MEGLFAPTEYDTEATRDVPHLNFEFDPEALSSNPMLRLVPGITSLYFANAEWQDEWRGETIF